MTALASGRAVYLEAYLRPLQAWLTRDDVTDILINQPGEIWVETLGAGMTRHAAPGLDETALWRLAGQIAAATHQGINREHPLLAATLPDGARVQIVAPPATRGPIAVAIRKHVVRDLSLADYEQFGAFAAVRRTDLEARDLNDALLQTELDAGRVGEFLRLAVRMRKNIIVSGGTSTGKTTFLNALIKEAPGDERLILIEDTPEIRLEHANAVGLIATRGDLGESTATVEDLLQAALRLRPDRIILGELRGPEAFSFLRSVNSGHPGSITTVHADSPRAAVEQIALMALQKGAGLGRAEIVAYVSAMIDVAVQLSRCNGARVVSDVVFKPRRVRDSAP